MPKVFDATPLPLGLQYYVKRHYEKLHGPVVKVAVKYNLLGQPNLREVTFADGFVASFCQAFDGTWFFKEKKRRVRNGRKN